MLAFGFVGILFIDLDYTIISDELSIAGFINKVAYLVRIWVSKSYPRIQEGKQVLANRHSVNLSAIIVIAIIALSTIPIVAFGVLSLQMIESTLLIEAQNFSAPIASVASDKVILSVKERLAILSAARATIQTSGNSKSGFFTATRNAGGEELFRRIELTDNNGVIIYGWPVLANRVGKKLNVDDYKSQFDQGFGHYYSSQYVSFENKMAVTDLIMPCGNGYLIGTFETTQIQLAFKSLLNYPNVVIGVLDSNGIWLANTDAKRASFEDNLQLITSKIQNTEDSIPLANDNGEQFMVYSKPIMNTEWHIIILSSMNTVKQSMDYFKMGIYLVVIVILLLSSSILLLINRRIKAEINQILSFTERISSGMYTLHTPTRMFREMETLLTNFEVMAKNIEKRGSEVHEKNLKIAQMNIQLEKRVKDRTEELRATNLNLEKAMIELRETQEQLIETERMANLGNLVAGVAHEINTPLGVSISATTYLDQQIHKIKEGYENNELKRSTMETALNKLIEGAAIIITNLNNAADLVRSFKQIAVDRSINEKRRINIREYIESVVLSLKPELRGHTVIIDVEPQDIHFDCNPGEFSQVIGNLLSNAVRHGFGPDEKGEIRIIGRIEDNRLVIRVCDNGVGIPEEHQKSIYEPFFTTKRGSGGTGLGLNIVYNIVNQKFGGTINCESASGEGTCFRLIIPFQSDAQQSAS